jgi:HSP20 family protein
MDPFEAFNTLFRDPLWERDESIYLKSKVDNNDGDYTFTVEVPGFDESEINIEVRDRYLEISAEHKEDSDGKYFHRSVHRSWSLPKGIKDDEVTASLKNGVLSVVVPKKELAEPKKVEIKALAS